MKKFGKFIFATLSVAAFAGGAYYFIKNIVNKDTVDEFDDFDDDFDDFDFDDDDADNTKTTSERGYVTLNTGESNDPVPDEVHSEETVEADAVSESAETEV